jgi:signal recognition particle receptor subunit beta
MHIDFPRNEIQLKIVYYGPAYAGKTTNLIQIHRLSDSSNRGELMSLNTKDDRTLYFDLLPLDFKSESGIKISIKLFTVPGQVMHNATRGLVLQGADAVAFVADSQLSQTEANDESFENLKDNLKIGGFDVDRMPVVIQYNKRDLPLIRSDAEIDKIAAEVNEPVYKSIATEGPGVVETLMGLIDLTWTRLDAANDLTGRLGIHRDHMIRELRKQLIRRPI